MEVFLRIGLPLIGLALLVKILKLQMRKLVSSLRHTIDLAKLNNKGFSITKVDKMDGYEFEFFVEKLFDVLEKDALIKIETTPDTGDHGCDLVLRYKNGKVWGIQCKCYSGNVGNEAVQQIVTSKPIYKLTDLMVVTNSYFTPGAKFEAKAHNVLLINRDRLDVLIKKYNKIINKT